MTMPIVGTELVGRRSFTGTVEPGNLTVIMTDLFAAEGQLPDHIDLPQILLSNITMMTPTVKTGRWNAQNPTPTSERIKTVDVPTKFEEGRFTVGSILAAKIQSEQTLIRNRQGQILGNQNERNYWLTATGELLIPSGDINVDNVRLSVAPNKGRDTGYDFTTKLRWNEEYRRQT